MSIKLSGTRQQNIWTNIVPTSRASHSSNVMPSASASRPSELSKLVSTRLKSSSACAYITPNTASASVLP